MRATTSPTGIALRLRDDEDRRALLADAAEALAQGLEDQSAPKDELRAALRDALLAECEDESLEAAARCELLRTELAAALRVALLSRGMSHLLMGHSEGGGDFAPRVRVEVRGTAGRVITKDAFSIGSNSYCDVQVYGDSTVMPLQCLVVPLPGGIVVADIWSGGCTHATWRWNSEEPGSPLFNADPSPGMVVGHEERIVFRIGAQATVTLGPRAKKASKKAGPTAHTKVVARPAPQAEKITCTPPREARKPVPTNELSKASTASGSSSSSSSSSSSTSLPPSRSRSPSCRRAPAGRSIAVCS